MWFELISAPATNNFAIFLVVLQILKAKLFSRSTSGIRNYASYNINSLLLSQNTNLTSIVFAITNIVNLSVKPSMATHNIGSVTPWYQGFRTRNDLDLGWPFKRSFQGHENENRTSHVAYGAYWQKCLPCSGWSKDTLHLWPSVTSKRSQYRLNCSKFALRTHGPVLWNSCHLDWKACPIWKFSGDITNILCRSYSF